jgi:hypothetical protein
MAYGSLYPYIMTLSSIHLTPSGTGGDSREDRRAAASRRREGARAAYSKFSAAISRVSL